MSKHRILTKAYERRFREVPKFNADERAAYVSRNSQNRIFFESLIGTANKVGFLLQWAYFNSKGRFFDRKQLKLRVKDKSMAEKIAGALNPVDLNLYDYQTFKRHQKMILKLKGWTSFGHTDEKELNSHAIIQVDKQKSKEETIFALLNFLWARKIEIPGYIKLESIVNNAYLKYETMIMERFSNNINLKQKIELDNLLDNPKMVNSFTEYKRIDQSTQQRKLNISAKILGVFKGVFLTIKPLIDKLELTPEAVKHFSDWIYKSDLNQIKNLKNKTMLRLRLTAFVQDQFFLRQDHAIDSILKRVIHDMHNAKKTESEIKQQGEKDFHASSLATVKSGFNAIKGFEELEELLEDDTYTSDFKVEKALYKVKSYLMEILPGFEQHATKIQDDIQKSKSNLDYYLSLFKLSISMQRALSPLLQTLVFDKSNSKDNIYSAVDDFAKNGDELDIDNGILSTHELEHINNEEYEYAPVTKYKVILFTHVKKAIRNKDLTLEYSYKYRAHNSYLISDEQWSKNKDEILEYVNLTKYSDGKDVLDTLGKDLTNTYKRVNKNFLEGNNKYLKVSDSGSWKLNEIGPDFSATKYIPNLLKESNYKLLYEILAEVDEYTQFSECFKHYSRKHSKESINLKFIYATLMSIGNNLGHHDMSRSTKGISRKILENTDKNRFSLKNIRAATKKLSKFIHKLPLPTIFNDVDGMIHSSSDGKKVVVAVDSILANYSYKYYGREQGISINSFIDQKQNFYHVNVLTSSDREAAYMMDGIVYTRASIFREGEYNIRHSTDTHGYTEPIFAGMHFLDVSFAPRIKNIEKQVMYAYEAKSLRKNTDSPIAPKTSINRKLILTNWDNILRFMATIKRGDSTASQLFKILSSSTKDNELYKAIREFGRLIKSKFILEYMDSEKLRRSIQKQLNLVELGQKLSGAVFFARKGKLFVGTPNEMLKVVACTALIKNAIVLWNYLFLSNHIHNLENEDEKNEVIESIRKGSVIAWQHISMRGFYDFDHIHKKSFSASIKDMMKIKIPKMQI